MRPTIRSIRHGRVSRATPAVLAAALALALLGGCASTSRNPRKDLMDSMNDFHTDLMWERYPEAAGYLPEEQRGEFLGASSEDDDDICFTEYEIGQIDLNAETEQATVIVTLRWYRVPYYVVEETEVRETWTLNEEDEYWWLTSRNDPDDPVVTERYRFATDAVEEMEVAADVQSTEGAD